MTKSEPQWANPGALGLAAFGLNTILLQIHNLGLINNTVPLIYGFFWGGIAQVITGIIEGKRGDAFGLAAFCSYGFFWLGLSLAFVLQWAGLVTLDEAGLGWTFVAWGIFTAIMTVCTFKMTRVHIMIFSSVTLLFFLLAAHYFWGLSAKVPGVVGIIAGILATYGAAAVILNEKYGKTVCPMGICK